jgi:hypothetical protein
MFVHNLNLVSYNPLVSCEKDTGRWQQELRLLHLYFSRLLSAASPVYVAYDIG